MKQETNKKKGGNKLFTFHNPLLLFCLFTFLPLTVTAANPFDNPDTIVVARDGTGQFRTIGQAIEVCRAFMDYHKVIYIKRGTYKEKLIVPEWLTNIELCGEDRDATIITYDDHANIPMDATLWPTPSEPSPYMWQAATSLLRTSPSKITLPNWTGCRPSHHRRSLAVCQLSHSWQSGHGIYLYCQHTHLFQGLLY